MVRGMRSVVAAVALAFASAGCERRAEVASGTPGNGGAEGARGSGARSTDTARGDVVTRSGRGGGNVVPGGDPAAGSRPRSGARSGTRPATTTGAAPARSGTATKSTAASTRSTRPAATRPGSAAASRDAAPCVVQTVSDGDTVRCADGRRVRLLLVDAPERSQPPFGDRARDALRTLAPPGTRLRLELDVRPTDQYGRTLAYLWRADGRMLNHEIVRGGWAVVLVYPPNVRHVDRLRAAADSARRERRGLYEVNGFECEPVEHRKGVC